MPAPGVVTAAPAWQGSRAARRAALLCLLLPLAGLAAGRADLVVLAAPLLVGTALALAAHLPRGVPAADGTRLALRVEAPGQVGQGETVDVRISVGVPPAAQGAVVRLPVEGSLPFGDEVAVAPRPGDGGPGEVRLTARVRLPLWGPVVVARPDVRLVGADALLLADPVTGPERTVRVLPGVGAREPAPLRARATGVVGAHRTRRAGEGLDLLDVREFRPGDSTRRIDWRVSARRGTLHVRRHALDADADVVLLLDTRLDVGPVVRDWPAPPSPPGAGTAVHGSSLDLTVRTATTLTAALLDQGDRVAVVDLARPRHSVAPGTGRRQLRRVRTRLVGAAVHWQARRLQLRPGVVQPGMVAVVLSPALDDDVADLVRRLRRRGAQVLLVDTLPDDLDLAHPVSDDPERDRTAARLVLRERAERLARVRATGAVVAPRGAAALARVLRVAARRRERVGR